jgi:hypothetical protein
MILGVSVYSTDAAAQLVCEITHDPHEVVLSYDDVTNFVRALEMMESETDSIAVLSREYLDEASVGLAEYVRAREFEAVDFLEAIRADRASFTELTGLRVQLASQEAAIREALSGMNRVTPNTSFVPVYYFVGTGHAGLQAEPSEHGLLLAISELAEDPSVLRLVIVHETVHVQQALAVGMEEYMQIFGPKMSLLALSIREGTAEYFTYLSTGQYAKQAAYDYLLAHESEIWTRFETDMNERLPGDWMFSRPEDPEQPVDLGYVVGARIVQSFYEGAVDKAEAVREILSITDFSDFLERSGYSDSISRER